MKKIAILLLLIIFQSNLFSQNYNISDFIGNWTGQWNNITFGSTGSTTMTLTSDVTNMTAQMILDMNGNVLGGADPAPMTLDGTYTDTEFTVSATTDLFGEFTLSVDNLGVLTGQGINIPNTFIDRVDFSGNALPNLITINYIVTFTPDAGGGTAVGILLFNTKNPLGIENISNGIVDDFSLCQNYPNPFNPITSINFSLPIDNHVTLSVYSLTGQLVRQLVDQSLNSGAYSIDWDGKDGFGNPLSGGVYIYNLQIENFNKTKKMILLK